MHAVSSGWFLVSRDDYIIIMQTTSTTKTADRRLKSPKINASYIIIIIITTIRCVPVCVCVLCFIFVPFIIFTAL